MENLFYELIQVSIGQLDCLSRGPSPEEWQQLYLTAQRQNVTGVCYNGVEKLFDFGLRAPQDVSIDWMAEAEEIRMGNAIVDKRCLTLQKRLIERKIHTCVLLGQGAARCYGDNLKELRQPSGIDVFVDCDKDKAIRFVKQTGQEEVRYNKHIIWLDKWEDTPVRVLPQVAYSKNLLKDSTVQRWFRNNRSLLFEKEGEMAMPAASMHLVYALHTISENLLYGHVDMRMLMDCFHIMKKVGGNFENFEGGMTIEKVLKSFGIGTFSGGVMWIMQTVFKADKKLLPIEPVQAEGEFILQQVMEGRNTLQMIKHYPLQMVWNII